MSNQIRVESRLEGRYMIYWLHFHNGLKNCYPTLEEAVEQCKRYPQYGPREIQDRIAGGWYTTAGILDKPTLATAGDN